MKYEQGPCTPCLDRLAVKSTGWMIAGSTSSLQEQGDQSWLAQGTGLLPGERTCVGRDSLRFGEVLAAAMPSQSQLQCSRAGQFSTSWMLMSCPCVLAGVCMPNTQIPVEELLEALKMFTREEIEAEQTDDESVDRHGAGLLREYQVWFSFSFPPGCTGYPSALPWVVWVGFGQPQNTSQH